jgi:hypothetical protein
VYRNTYLNTCKLGRRRENCYVELNDLYSSPTIVQVIKSRRMRWAGHVARMGRREACIGFWWGNLRERDHWGDPGVGGRIILGWIFSKCDVGWLRIGTIVGHL